MNIIIPHSSKKLYLLLYPFIWREIECISGQDAQYSVTVFDNPNFDHGFQPVLLCEVSNQE